MIKNQNRSPLTLSVALSAVLALGGLAVTPVATAQSSSSARLEEVVVTARKREETVLETPLAVTAISSLEIAAADFENILDVAKATPGLVFEGYNSFASRQDSVPFVRGVVFDSSSALRQTVSTFIDGIYLVGSAKGIPLDNLERIEIIKGPQSAQFGRATFGGAINYITKDPGEELSGRLSAEVATYDKYQISASIEGGLIGDTLTGRLSGTWIDKGSQHGNGGFGADQGEEETQGINGTLVWKPIDPLRVRAKVHYTELDDGPAAVALFDATWNRDIGAGPETIFVGTLPDVSEARRGLNTTQADVDAFRQAYAPHFASGAFAGLQLDHYGFISEATRMSLDVDYQITDNLTLTAMYGQNEEESTFLIDVDYSSDKSFDFYSARIFDDSFFEVRLTGSALSDRLDWSIGYSDLAVESQSGSVFPLWVFGIGGATPPGLGRTEVDTTGIFGQLSYQVTDWLKVSAEARRQEDNISSFINRGNDFVRKLTFENTLPRFTIDVTPVENSLLYLSYSEGNLPGGNNGQYNNLTESQRAEVRAQIPGIGPTYEEEILEQIEIGWKQSFEGGDIQIALFDMQRLGILTNATALYTNPNVPGGVSGATFQTNTRDDDIEGVELEANWYPTDELSLRATVAYASAEVVAFPETGDSGFWEDVYGSDDGYIGTSAERYPEWKWSLSSTYTKPLGRALFGESTDWFVRGDMFWSDEFFLTNVNVGRAPASLEVNIRGGVQSDRFSFELYVKNLFNEDAPRSANNGTDLTFNTQGPNPCCRLPGVSPFGVAATNIGLRDKQQFGLRVGWNF